MRMIIILPLSISKFYSLRLILNALYMASVHITDWFTIQEFCRTIRVIDYIRGPGFNNIFRLAIKLNDAT